MGLVSFCGIFKKSKLVSYDIFGFYTIISLKKMQILFLGPFFNKLWISILYLGYWLNGDMINYLIEQNSLIVYNLRYGNGIYLNLSRK